MRTWNGWVSKIQLLPDLKPDLMPVRGLAVHLYRAGIVCTVVSRHM